MLPVEAFVTGIKKESSEQGSFKSGSKDQDALQMTVKQSSQIRGGMAWQ